MLITLTFFNSMIYLCNIRRNINRRQKTAKGYKWEYKNK